MSGSGLIEQIYWAFYKLQIVGFESSCTLQIKNIELLQAPVKLGSGI